MLAHPVKLWRVNTDLRGGQWYRDQNEPAGPSRSLREVEHHIVNPTNSRGALDDGVEHRLHVRGRAADDAEHLGRRRLMFQGLAQFCVAFRSSLNSRTFSMAITAWSAKVSRRAICLSVNGSDLHSANQDSPDRKSLTKQRHGKRSPMAEPFCAASTSGNSCTSAARS